MSAYMLPTNVDSCTMAFRLLFKFCQMRKLLIPSVFTVASSLARLLQAMLNKNNALFGAFASSLVLLFRVCQISFHSKSNFHHHSCVTVDVFEKSCF